MAKVYLSVDFVLLIFGLFLDHQESMIEQEYLELGTFALCAASLLHWPFQYQLS